MSRRSARGWEVAVPSRRIVSARRVGERVTDGVPNATSDESTVRPEDAHTQRKVFVGVGDESAEQLAVVDEHR